MFQGFLVCVGGLYGGLFGLQTNLHFSEKSGVVKYNFLSVSVFFFRSSPKNPLSLSLSLSRSLETGRYAGFLFIIRFSHQSNHNEIHWCLTLVHPRKRRKLRSSDGESAGIAVLQSSSVGADQVLARWVAWSAALPASVQRQQEQAHQNGLVPSPPPASHLLTHLRTHRQSTETVRHGDRVSRRVIGPLALAVIDFVRLSVVLARCGFASAVGVYRRAE